MNDALILDHIKYSGIIDEMMEHLNEAEIARAKELIVAKATADGWTAITDYGNFLMGFPPDVQTDGDGQPIRERLA